jgi:hypothetical protein
MTLCTNIYHTSSIHLPAVDVLLTIPGNES